VQLLSLLRGLTSGGTQATVICAADSALEREVGRLPHFRVVPVNFSPAALPRLFATVRTESRNVRLVQSTGFLTSVVASLATTRTGTPVVRTVHVVPGAARLNGESARAGALRDALERITRARFTCSVAVSEAVRAGLIARGVRPDTIRVIPNGIDVEQLRRRATEGGTFKPHYEGARVGFIGRLERVKGCEYFLRAAARVATDHPSVRFVVAGHGPMERELSRLAADLGVTGHVDFAGHVESAPALLASLDVVVIPSLSEASGLIAMEAAALGIPVVASLVGGLPETVAHGRTGLLVPPADPEAISRAISRLLDTPDLAQRMGQEGQRRADEQFGVARMVEAYLRLYRELGA
jgi:glycosyltransferase involved in cell wall biosynthesis